MSDEVSIFECIDSFVIKGRGPVLTGYVTGLVAVGDTLVLGEQRSVIKDIEHNLVYGWEKQEYRRTIGFLVGGDQSDYVLGTNWTIERAS